jgi:hypothetical protein
MRSSIALIALSLADLGALGCVRETVSCADNPSAVCPEIDTGTSDIDAAVRTDANTDAFSVFDAFMPDAGNDAFIPDAYIVPDATMCNPACSGARDICISMNVCGECRTDADCGGSTPACNMATNTCVACTASNVMGCPSGMTACTDDHRCVQCIDGTSCTAPTVCDTTPGSPRINQCVGCVSAANCSGPTPACDAMSQTCAVCTTADRRACTPTQPDCDVSGVAACTCNGTSCTNVTASRCNLVSNGCEACTVAGDCAHLSATPQCRTGTCVQCLNNTHCAANQACNTATNRCVPITIGGAGRCETCLRDTQCGAGMLCVPMTYDDPSTPASDPVAAGFHCLQRQATVAGADCINTRPHASPQMFTSIDGTTDVVCGLRASTCEAQAAFDMTNCMTLDASGNDRCGAAGLNDGVCRMRSVTTNRCSVYCVSNDDCRSGTSCNTALNPGVCTF